MSGQCRAPRGFFTMPRAVQRQNRPALLQRGTPTIQRPKCMRLAVKSGARRALRGTARKRGLKKGVMVIKDHFGLTKILVTIEFSEMSKLTNTESNNEQNKIKLKSLKYSSTVRRILVYCSIWCLHLWHLEVWVQISICKEKHNVLLQLRRCTPDLLKKVPFEFSTQVQTKSRSALELAKTQQGKRTHCETFGKWCPAEIWGAKNKKNSCPGQTPVERFYDIRVRLLKRSMERLIKSRCSNS